MRKQDWADARGEPPAITSTTTDEKNEPMLMVNHLWAITSARFTSLYVTSNSMHLTAFHFPHFTSAWVLFSPLHFTSLPLGFLFNVLLFTSHPFATPHFTSVPLNFISLCFSSPRFTQIHFHLASFHFTSLCFASTIITLIIESSIISHQPSCIRITDIDRKWS